MTLEDALRVARGVDADIFEPLIGGKRLNHKCKNPCEIDFLPEQLLAFARQVEAETIERCAKVCRDRANREFSGQSHSSGMESASWCEDQIRALSSPIEQIAAEPKCKTCECPMPMVPESKGAECARCGNLRPSQVSVHSSVEGRKSEEFLDIPKFLRQNNPHYQGD